MEINELSELISKNLSKVLSINGYKHLLNRGNNLIRFDVINRVLIEIQNQSAFDIKTAEEWLMDGRKVSDRAKPIYTILPKYTSKYIDKETGKDIDKNDLNSDEIVKALEYKIIEKVDVMENLYTLPMYDIRETFLLNEKDTYSINKPILGTKELLNLLSNYTSATIELCDECYYSKSQNIIFISKMQYKELASTVSNIISQFIIDNELKTTIDTTSEFSFDEFSDYDIELIKISIEYALNTILLGNTESDFSIVAHTNNDKLISILNIVDSSLIGVYQYIKFTDTNIADASYTINRIRKAEAILDVMEANGIHKKMKGA